MKSVQHRVGMGLSLLGAALCALACKGSSGGAPAQATVTASGKVSLPPGTTLPLAGLTLGGALGSMTLGATGAFTVSEVAGGGPATVLLSDPSGKIVLLGHVDSDDPSFADVSATSTAIELLFLATSATTLPYGEWKHVYKLLAAAPETATLAAVIATRAAASPTAVGDQDPAILDALKTATASLLGTAALSGMGAGPDQGLRVTVQQPDEAATAASSVLSVNVQSTDPFGLSVVPSLDGKGITLSNSVRIHRHYFVYRTAYVPAAGASNDPPTQLSTWQLVEDGYLPATTGVTGLVSSLADYFGGKTAWAAQTKNVALTLVPPDAKANVYQVYLVGPGASAITSSPELAGQSDALAAIAAARNDAIVLEAFKEILWPIITKLFPEAWNAKLWADPAKYGPAIKIFNQFLKEAGSAGVNYAVQLEKGDLRPTLVDISKALGSNKQLKAAVYNLLVNMLDPREGVVVGGVVEPDPSWVSNALSQVASAINIVDKILTATDIVSIGTEVAKSQVYNRWDVKAITPTVVVTPTSATLNQGTTKADFTATVQGYASATSQYLYQWDCGINASLDDHHGKTGNLITTDQMTVTYSVLGTMPTQGQDTVTIEVFDPNRNSLGKASAKIVFAPDSYSLAVSPTSSGALATERIAIAAPLSKTPPTATAKVTWEWSATGNLGGALQAAGSSGSPLVTSAGNATYVVPAGAISGQSDTVTIRAYLGSTVDPSVHTLLAQGLSTITIKPPYTMNSYTAWAYSKFSINGVVIADNSTLDLVTTVSFGFNFPAKKGDQLRVVLTSWQFAQWYQVPGRTTFPMGPITVTTPDGVTVTVEQGFSVPAPATSTVLYDQTVTLP